LAGAAGAALGRVPGEVATGEGDAGGAFARGAEIDIEKAGPVKGAEGGDAVAEAGEEDGEFGAGRSLEFRRGDELDADAGGGLRGAAEIDGDIFLIDGEQLRASACGSQAFSASRVNAAMKSGRRSLWVSKRCTSK